MKNLIMIISVGKIRNNQLWQCLVVHHKIQYFEECISSGRLIMRIKNMIIFVKKILAIKLHVGYITDWFDTKYSSNEYDYIIEKTFLG